jgi:hypothetical protein
MKLADCKLRGGGGATPYHLPSLRHLAYEPLYNLPPEAETSFFNSITPTLLTLILEFDRWTNLSSIAHVNPHVSLQYVVSALHPPTDSQREGIRQNLRLRLISESSSETFLSDREAGSLFEWTSFLSQTDNIQTLTLSPVRDLSSYLQLYRDALNGLLQVCRTRQIEVIREDIVFSWRFWEGVSPSFIRRSEARSSEFMSSSR